MQAFVPKHRRPKFDLQLRILDLNNVPLVSGISYVKWHIPGSAAAEHRGRTERRAIKEHKVFYAWEKHIPVRITIQNKSKMLEDAWMHFEVIQEYSAGGKNDRIVLGKVDLNLSEYVEASELEANGVVRRYLMQENLPTLSKNSRADGELQDMYRRTEIAFWAAQPGELRADECIEDIFGGGDGWGGTEGKQMGDRLGVDVDSTSLSDSGSRSPLRGWHRTTPSQGSNKSQDTLKKVRMAGHERGLSIRGRASLEQQANQMKAEAQLARPRPANEVDELDVRDDLRKFTQPEIPIRTVQAAQPEIRRESADYNENTHLIRTVASDRERPTGSKTGPKPKPERRGRHGQTIKETSATLQRQSLGERSEVLILRDLTPLPKKEDKASAVAPAEENEAARRRREIREALEASIAGQSAVAGQEEANEQINKLRPVSAEGRQYPPFITRQAAKALRKALKDGYAVGQLRRYAAVHEGLVQLQELKREERAEQSLLWQSAWQEGVSPIEQRLPEPEKTDVPLDRLPKMKVVDRILWDLWNVNIIEENGAVGEIEIKLEPWQFDLLTLAKQGGEFTILDNIGHQRRIRIDLYRPECILRFTAERENGEQAVTDIARVLRRFTASTLNLKHFESLRQKRGLDRLMDFFSTKDLEVTARLSNVVIDSSSKSSVGIYGVNGRTVDLAKRMLLGMINPPTGAETAILADAEGDGFLQSCATESALHYRHRKKNYGRWTFPVQRDSTKEEKSQAVDEEPGSKTPEGSTTTSTEAPPDHSPDDRKTEAHDDSTKEEKSQAVDEEPGSETPEGSTTTSTEAPPDHSPDNLNTEAHDADSQPRLAEKIIQFFTAPSDNLSDVSKGAHDSAESKRLSYWQPSALTEFYATFGNVLHKPPPNNDSLSPISLPNILEHGGHPSRVFLHTVPGFSPLLQHLATYTRLNRHANEQMNPDALLFRFMPSPWDLEDPSSLEDFPDLGFRVELAKKTGKARFQGLGLTTRERTIDVLMPGKPVDVRFTQREVLWTNKVLDLSTEVRDYLSNISTNIDLGGSIWAPLTLTIRIPAWVVKNSEKYSSLPVQYTDRGKEIVKQFIFTAVEHRQMCRYDLPDSNQRVSYTSVEGGRFGGRRGELRVRLRRPARDLEQLQEQVPDLVDGALNVASMIDDAVHGKLLAEPVRIQKIARHAAIKRLTPEGRFEEPFQPNIRYADDEGGKNVESAGGKTKQASFRAEEAPLKAGEN
ncbi:hypothetical protein SLS58_010726 [Diplodia intermedia]|uniref:C2 NT-type domain-containing protein n=1 Tax=Diplodia intermedia TaxID=856260 RepID=A0ABR3T3Z3_9PEZI